MSLARAFSRARFFGPCLALGLTLAQPAFAADGALAPEARAQLVALSTGEVQSFYAYGAGALWTHADGSLDPAAVELVGLIETADDDGLSPQSLHATELADAVNQAQADRTPQALANAEVALSRAFVAYVNALRQADGTAMKYEAGQLEPHAYGAYQTLNAAAKAPSLADYVRDMAWMHPLYAPLRRALMADSAISPEDRQLAVRNLQRIRNIPAQPSGRHILIDAASARLWMYEGDKAVDSMKVVVGKPEKPTPAYAGYIRSAYLNPYWNVPADMVRSIIARNVLNQGMSYLKRQGYEVISKYGDDAEVIDPHTIDWPAVQRGELKIFVRQLPGPRNSMGAVKFEFPNPYGVYLHDTPERDTLAEDSRQLSAGCIRLQDAKRLGSWLMEEDIQKLGDAPEQRIELPQPVPIYITYLTARVDNGQLAFSPDPYGRDTKALAALD
jgi:L,D-transpeptidase YcbB